MNKVLIGFFLIITSSLKSQNNNEVGLKGQLHFTIGTEYRVTPIRKIDGDSTSESFFTNVDKQNSGIGLLIGGEYFLHKNISLHLGGSARYDDVVNKPPTTITDFSQTVDKRSLLIGYHFNLNYHFKVFRKGKVYIGAGYSLLNRNSSYTTEQIFFDDLGNIIDRKNVSGDYKFSALKFSLGYRTHRSKFGLGIYISGKTPYYEESTTFIIPHLSYKFSLFRLQK